MCGGALLSWRWLNCCLPMRSGEWIPSFSLLMWVAFVLPIKVSLSQPRSFLTFTLLSLPLILLQRERVCGCVGLGCWLGLNQDSIPSHSLWGTQWNEVRARYNACLLHVMLAEGYFFWCEGNFLFLFLEWDSWEMWRQQPCSLTGALKSVRQIVQYDLLVWPWFWNNAAVWYREWCW